MKPDPTFFAQPRQFSSMYARSPESSRFADLPSTLAALRIRTYPASSSPESRDLVDVPPRRAELRGLPPPHEVHTHCRKTGFLRHNARLHRHQPTTLSASNVGFPTSQ